ncbi:MAG TPA: hypothetical protein VGX24_15630 [Pyrinomonadaceae bacterium]|nr:hypothetical protein [Pyrinomonadaceae bacterium]
MNSSNRFSAQAEVAHVNAGRVPPSWQHEARFRPAIAEQSDLCQRTHPAVGFNIQLISSATCARRLLSGVYASVARY